MTDRQTLLNGAAVALLQVTLLVGGLPADEPDEFTRYGIYAETAPRAAETARRTTQLPLDLPPGARIALVGNTLFDRAQWFGQFEALLQQRFPRHQLVVRNLAWSADEVDLQPRPDNFADVEQHLTHERADVVFVAFGFNESFAGEPGLDDFRDKLTGYVRRLTTRAFNGTMGPQVVLVSPVANENTPGVDAGCRNNPRIAAYTRVMREVAQAEQVGFANVFGVTEQVAAGRERPLTINGVHLNHAGYDLFAKALYEQVFGDSAPKVNESLREAIVDKNRQYHRRYRPLNTFYYTGGRNKAYGYLDFLPAMRNFDLMVANRERRIWKLAAGEQGPDEVDDSNVPPLPRPPQSRGANEWLTPDDQLKAFQVDPRFEVHLFASEVEFPEIACPIQIRWDAQGRLWVSCSTTYPHVYPGNEPSDKLVILEDTNGDGRADRSTVFAEGMHIPLSFEFGDGGVYVSEQPHLTFLKDTTGDGRADHREIVLTGFGTEDSHHSVHDMTWTPDGDLIFREGIFHHSQVETPYGPVRQRNSGWFRYQPRDHRLVSFGSYPSTNPWGVTFDRWGQHLASHPVYAAAFHALDPPYPEQNPRPQGLQAYSGVCGHEFVDFATFPEELQDHFIKVRYKPTNRVEIHQWKEGPFGYHEEYIGDLIFSTNLSFIPTDIRFGPRGDLFICDWFNPIKGHAQYALRDDRRDRHSGRIWRVTAKGRPLQDPPNIAGAAIDELLELLKRPEYRYRYWAKRELRERDAEQVRAALEVWVAGLDRDHPDFRHHQLEAVWAYRWIHAVNTTLVRELLECDEPRARAAATQQLRWWHGHLPDAMALLRGRMNDPHAIVRMEAAIAASYIGTHEAFEILLEGFRHPRDGHLAYALAASLRSHTIARHWKDQPRYQVERLLKQASGDDEFKEPTPTAAERAFDRQRGLKQVNISCIPERMLFTVDEFVVRPGQPVKLVFTNPDATDHNLVIVRPGALAEVGMAANEMAKDPRNANSDFLPPGQRDRILAATTMIGPTRNRLVDVLRLTAPEEPGLYSFVCTYPGHWVVMNGVMVVASSPEERERLLAEAAPKLVQAWTMEDFAELEVPQDEKSVQLGMQAFMKARCHQCHEVAGHGVNLGPDLREVVKRYQGAELLKQLIEPSSTIPEAYRTYQFLLEDGRVVTGVIAKQDEQAYQVMTNLLTPHSLTHVNKRDVEEKIASTVSAMPEGLLNGLTREEIVQLLAYLEHGNLEAHGPASGPPGHEH